MTLFLPIGPPASGKSTLVQMLLDRDWLDYDAIVCPDDYRRILTGDHSNQDANALVFELCERIAQARLRVGLDVWYDATNLVDSWYANLIGSAHFFGQPVVSVYFDTDDNECLRRNAEREKPVPVEAMETMLTRRRQIQLSQLPGVVFGAHQFIWQIYYSLPMPPV